MPLSALPADPAHLHAILGALPGNFILLRPDAPTYTIVAMSAELLRQTGRQAAQVVGQSVFVAYPANPDEAASTGPARMRAALDASLRDHQPHELPLVRYDVPTPGGIFEERHWSGRSQAILDGQGQVLYLLFTSVDRTAQQRVDHKQRARQQAEARNRELEARVQERPEQVRAQSQRLERLFRQAPAAICILGGPELVFELVNPIYQQFFPDRPLLGKPLREALPELADHAAYYTMKRVFDTGEPSWQQALHAPLARTADGVLEDRYFNYVQQPRYDEQGRIDGVLVFGFEVTELVQAQQRAEALQAEVLAATQHQVQERETFYQVFEQTPAAICIQRGPDHRYEYLNAAYQAFFPGRAFLGHPVAEVLPETVDSGVVALLDRVYQTGETYYGEELPLLIAQPDGHPPRQMYFTFTYQALRENGEIVGISTFAYNVAEQVLARRALEESEARFRTMADAAPNLVWAVHPDASVRYINRTFLDFVGLAEEHAYLATGWAPYIHPDDADLTTRTLAQAIAQRMPYVLEHRMRRHDGQYRWLLLQGAPSYLPGGALYGYVGSAIDITDLKQANEQLQRTNADLDNFIYTASHDLKAPIGNIEGLLQALQHELPAAGQVGHVPVMLGMMQQAIERFKRTITHLTDFSRLQKEYEQPATQVLVASVVHEVQLDLAPLLAETGGAFDVQVPADMTLTFSEKNLRSIVYNLFSNALKYRHPDRPPRVRVACRPTPDGHVLEVADNGLGVDLSRGQAKLFGLFQRLHTHVEGSGVGLHMVQRIVQNAGGRIEVESQLGHGTTFRVYFPR